MGRGGDAVIDDNPYLHRTLLQVASRTGSGGWPTSAREPPRRCPTPRASPPVDGPGRADAAGVRAYRRHLLRGPVQLRDQPVRRQPGAPGAGGPAPSESGDTTVGTSFTESQLLAILAVREPPLQNWAPWAVPSAVQAATRPRLDADQVQPEARQRLRQAGQGRRALKGGRAVVLYRRARLAEYAGQRAARPPTICPCSTRSAGEARTQERNANEGSGGVAR